MKKRMDVVFAVNNSETVRVRCKYNSKEVDNDREIMNETRNYLEEMGYDRNLKVLSQKHKRKFLFFYI